MKLYKREIKPVQVPPALQGFSCIPEDLEDWQPEENEKMLREKYEGKLSDSWATLEFKERYVRVK